MDVGDKQVIFLEICMAGHFIYLPIIEERPIGWKEDGFDKIKSKIKQTRKTILNLQEGGLGKPKDLLQVLQKRE